MKRKELDSGSTYTQSPTKRRNVSPTPNSSSDLKKSFRQDLFDPATLKSFSDDYANSSPYPHAVVRSLIEDNLLRSVRKEITTHVHFTLKETDIYRIHQSGDLANLSKLDAESLAHLPSLVQLRDALYSDEFRMWISEVTGAGKLSGIKTDMAVNVYTPGSYLLCHDDVIGSRRVSYILYLTDPDDPWKPEWGGGLRLHATEVKKNEKGEDVKVPLADHTVNIPPSFGQLSFFAVRPGESYHDVEEVYHSDEKDEEARRIRMAISGWYHIPQEGEDGFEKGAEEAQTQRSSLAQLKGTADEFDEPSPIFNSFAKSGEATLEGSKRKTVAFTERDDTLTEEDLDFLLEFIAPSFLTPEMTEKLASSFGEESFLQLEGFLRDKFVKTLKLPIQHMGGKNLDEGPLPLRQKARPPHKHRFLYSQDQNPDSVQPITTLLGKFLPSTPFKKWLALITGTSPSSLLKQNVIARRFRKGHDYALASAYKGDEPQLEFTIGLTPSTGWEESDEKPLRQNGDSKTNGHKNTNGNNEDSTTVQVNTTSRTEFGGEEVYMAGDDEEEDNDDDAAPAYLPQVGKKAAHDPAVYKVGEDDEDDNILFINTPSWNTFSLVLRDKGTLRFVKYLSAAARGDRWDVKGEVQLAEDAFDSEEGEGDEEEVSDEEVEGEFEEGDEDEEDEESDVWGRV